MPKPKPLPQPFLPGVFQDTAPKAITTPAGICVEFVPIDDVQEDAENVRTHPSENLDAIERSLKQFGQRKPIVVRHGIIVAGNGTHIVAKRMGWTTIAITRADDLTEAQAKAYAIADNKTSDMSEFDFQKLSLTMQQLQSSGIDLLTTGFRDLEIVPLLDGWKPEPVDAQGASSDAGGNNAATAAEDAQKGVHTVKFTQEQWLVIEMGIQYARTQLQTKYDVTHDSDAIIAVVYEGTPRG